MGGINAQGKCLRNKRWSLATFQAFVLPNGVHKVRVRDELLWKKKENF